MPFEIEIIRGMQMLALATPWTVACIIFCARFAIFLNLFPAIHLLCDPRQRRRHAVYEALWSVLLALALTAVIGMMLHRDRPFIISSDVLLLIPPPLTTAFPSGHTATAVAIACALLSVSRTAGILSFAIAGFVAFGRMAAGVHFPTDILGGVCVGALSFALVRLGHAALRSKNIPQKARHRT